MAVTAIRPDVRDLSGGWTATPPKKSKVWSGARLRFTGVLLALSVTVKVCRPYALTVGALTCFVVSAALITPALGWAVAGVSALLFQHQLEREKGR